MAITDPNDLTFGGYTDPNAITFGSSDPSSDPSSSSYDWSKVWSGLGSLAGDLAGPAAAAALLSSNKNNNKNVFDAIKNMKPYSIPEDQLKSVVTQIAGNQALSDSARNLAINNLSSAASGKLSSAYQPIYDQTMSQAKTQLQERLSAQGFNQNSTQYNSAMEAYGQYAASTYAGLLQSEVGTALQSAGLSDMAIKDYLNMWGTEASLLQQNNNMYSQQAHLYNEANYVTAQNNAALGKAAGHLDSNGNWVSDIIDWVGGVVGDVVDWVGNLF